MPRIMTVKEVSKYLRIHPTTVYRLAKTGLIPAFKIGDSWRFDVNQIDKYVESGATAIPSTRGPHKPN